jgi:hypothetical protein
MSRYYQANRQVYKTFVQLAHESDDRKREVSMALGELGDGVGEVVETLFDGFRVLKTL